LKIGINSTALEEQDIYDYRIPRALNGAVSAYFDRMDWDPDYSSFGSDIRKEFKDYQAWDFSITGIKGRSIDIYFSNIGEITDEMEIYLLNLVSMRYQDLREKDSYYLDGEMAKYDFRLMVGKAEKLMEEINKMMPVEYSIGQNYPNPFNPETTIPLEVPEDGRISVSVYNIIGQKIAILFEGDINRGRHFFKWDGMDWNRRQVPTGVYFYRVQFHTGQVLTGKMILMK
jgi:hypothetical protein